MRRPALSATGAVLAVALLLTGCGSDDEPDAGTATGTTEDDAFPRTVEHAMGSTEIPERPERVVVLDTGELDSALSLGVTPVGAVTTAVSDGFLSYLADDAEGVEVVGTIAEPDLEAIAAAEPDLILSNKVRHEALYDQLSQIAPTVFAEEVGVVWKENFELAAEALGLEDEAADVLDEYRAEAAALGDAVGEPAPTIGAVRFVGGGAIRVYTPESFLGSVLADAGLGLLALPTERTPTFAEVSPELITSVDADVVLHSSYGAPDESGEADVVAGPLWPLLPAVAADRAHAVDDDVFFTGIGLTAARLQLERLTELLAG
ncbi:iron-siderophore ABC transporter substrate-binding protein [Blastococcus sp. TML/M2B]|uniref:ABC transporter substrate-binding protein n=1 Tax=unclassified Blastococcus TaxID=2619396 RepID=UPI00190AF651|nr:MULTISPECIES: iron-siderophore ABC transporter substrate-binding protein [unclassified Blastococcus]MBN1091871.1 iron-siderophore ABC transporter substrate-binding protein [Blastococcus sp. TML/M2B]MBN1098022.1 iron-siderophore ABC transporter substrate-binding protein [Blastococcus sp. TML/C7B]